MMYCQTKFGVGFLGRGMGFGNRLFPWARCRIFSRLNSAKMISPVWLRPAIGQLFRGGVNYKNYLHQLVLFGLFKRREGDYNVVYGFLRTRNISLLKEPEYIDVLCPFKSNQKDVKYLFSGYENYFAVLNKYNKYLLDELRLITKKKYILISESFGDVPIGICVRCGNDFAEPDVINGRILPGQKTPLVWFVKSLNAIRKRVGYPCKAIVVSDGTSQQLNELLSLENVFLKRPASAISDLLVLSKAQVLIGAGSSSFVAWGCFLGQMPSISHPGQPLTDWNIIPQNGQYIGEFDPDNPSEEFMSQVSRVLKK